MEGDANSREISFVVAMDRNRVIGVDGDLPWRLSDDLKFFKRITLNKPIIMGRKTYESIGRPLPKRINIILTRRDDYTAEGCLVVHSVEDAFAACGDAPEIMIVGGAEVYRLFLPIVTRLYVTHVDAAVEGDTFFPAVDWSDWAVFERTSFEANERNRYRFEIVGYQKLVAELPIDDVE